MNPTLASEQRKFNRIATPQQVFTASIYHVDYIGEKIYVKLDSASAAKEVILANHEREDIRNHRVSRGDEVAFYFDGGNFRAIALYAAQNKMYLPIVSNAPPVAPIWNSLQVIGGNLVGSFNISPSPNITRYQLWKRLTTDDPSAAVLFDDSIATNFTLPYNTTGNSEIIVMNPGFESGDLTGYELGNLQSGTIDIVTTPVDTGVYALHMKIDNTGGVSVDPLVSARSIPFQVLPSTAYDLHLRLSVTSIDANIEFEAKFFWKDVNNQYLTQSSLYERTTTTGGYINADLTGMISHASARYAVVVVRLRSKTEPALTPTTSETHAYVDNISVIGQAPIQASHLFALKAIDANNNASPFSAWLQPSQSSQAMGNPSSAHTQINYNAAGYVSSTLAPGAGVAQTPNGFTDTGWNVPLISAANPISETWVYVSASSFKIVGLDATLRYKSGTLLKWKQTTTKFGTVASSTYASGDTTVTIFVNTDYTIANAAISNNFYSYAATPPDFPDWFNWTPGFTGFSANPTNIVARYKTVGKMAIVVLRCATAGTSNANTFTVTGLPITSSNITNAIWMIIVGSVDNGVNIFSQAYIPANSTTVTLQAGNPNPIAAGWTAAGNKSANFTAIYEFG